MAGMAALQGAMAGLSVSAPGAASTSSFWGNRLATYSAPQPGVRCWCLPNSVPLCCSNVLANY